MKKKDYVCPSVKDLEELNAAFYDGSRFIWKSDPFRQMEELLGADIVLDAVNKNKFPEYGGRSYHFSRTAGDEYDIIMFFPEEIAMQRENTNIIGVMTANIKDYVTNMSFMSDELYGFIKEKGMECGESNEIFRRMNKSAMTLWQKTIFVDLVLDYAAREEYEPHYDGFFDVMFIAKIFGKQISNILNGSGATVTVNGCGDLFGRYLNYNHLRIVLSLAVRDIFSLNYKPDYIYIDVKDKGSGMAAISVSGGTMNRIPANMEKNKRIHGSLNDLPVDEFVNMFCRRYDCSINKNTTEYEHSMEISMPVYQGSITEEERELLMTRDRFSCLPTRFSPEVIVLSDIVSTPVYR